MDLLALTESRCSRNRHSKKQQELMLLFEEASSEEKLAPEKEFGSEVFMDSDVPNHRQSGYDDASYRFQLEEDVKKLEQQLQEEVELHTLLEKTLHQQPQTLSHLRSHMPLEIRELLGSITSLEVTISKLEEETVFLHYQLSQERNERRLLEYRSNQSPLLRSSASLSSSEGLKNKEFSPLNIQVEDPLARSLINESSSIRSLSASNVMPKAKSTVDSYREPTTFRNPKIYTSQDAGVSKRIRKSHGNTSFDNFEMFHTHQRSYSEKKYMSFWQKPNQLSEEMVRCMRDIFIHLGDPEMASSKFLPSSKIHSPRSPLGNTTTASSSSFSESSSIFSFVKSPSVDIQFKEGVIGSDNTFDPYNSRGKLHWADIGRYSSAIEISWMSVGKEQLEYAADALRRFRLLVEQLAKVNPGCMTHDQRLAFWINIYNALMMHAYLAYGVPKSDLKLFALMQKAAYTVGGHSFNAVSIEYVILKMKPPMHRPQIALLLALHKFKLSEEQSQFAVDRIEPLATFALSSGVHSSPAVRVITAENVHSDLQEAIHDYIRASAGISSKGKLLIPKLLHCFAKGIIQDHEIVNWICQFLSPSQAALVQGCMTKRRQRFLGSRDYSVVPFDIRFRYLFLLQKQK